ncbi:porin [Marinobacter sp.]|uniref:porin n=1 Tax=Marinobacter sp. TaxID=50741 RepID=UPI0034A2A170
MFKQKQLSVFLSIIVASAVSGPTWAQDSSSKVDIETYGHLNIGYMNGDTGDGSESYIVDNDNSASRVGAKLSGYVDELGMTVGVHAELEYQQNASNLVTSENRSIDGDFNERQLNVFAQGGFGKVSLGQGDGAANGNIERDLSGTNVVSFANPALIGGALSFIDRGAGDEVALKSAMSDQDFESRYDRLRYDAPSLGPVDLSVSQGVKGNDDVTEVGGRVSVPFAGKLAAGLGYSVKDVGGATGDVTTAGGSVSWLHSTGISLTGAFSRIEDDDSTNPDSDFYLLKLGYKVGKHAFDVHYAEAEDRAAEGDSADTKGVGYVYTPVKWLNLYAGYNNHSLERRSGDYEDVNTVLVGSRLKF